MDAIYRNLLAFWVGGGGGAIPETYPAYGSMLAFWMGGVGKGRPATSVGGVTVGGVTVGGYRKVSPLLRYMAQEQYHRSLLDEQSMAPIKAAMLQRAATGVWLRKLEQEHQQKCLEWAAYSVVLSEV